MHLLSLLFCLNSFALDSLPELEQSFFLQEKATPNLKESAYKHIVFYDIKKQPTKTSILYLHGFSASPKEASPLSENLAKSLKANLYIPRYSGHGFHGTEGLRGITLENWQADTLEALSVAKKLGDEVIVIAMSTAAPIAIHEILKDSKNIKALLLLSPNFGLPRWDSELLLFPGGAWLAKLIVGEYREWTPKNHGQKENWTTRYPSSILVEVMRAVQLGRRDDYSKLLVPTLALNCENDTVIDTKIIPAIVRKIKSAQQDSFFCEEDSHVFVGEILSPKTSPKILDKIQKFLSKLI